MNVLKIVTIVAGGIIVATAIANHFIDDEREEVEKEIEKMESEIEKRPSNKKLIEELEEKRARLNKLKFFTLITVVGSTVAIFLMEWVAEQKIYLKIEDKIGRKILWN